MLVLAEEVLLPGERRVPADRCQLAGRPGSTMPIEAEALPVVNRRLVAGSERLIVRSPE